MSSPVTRASMTLEQQIQALPQELRDIIFGFAIVVESNKTISIDRRYKPPMQIAVNSKTRRDNAPKHYSNNIFFSANACKPNTTRNTSYGRSKNELVLRWLGSLHHEHVHEIRNLYLGWSVHATMAANKDILPLHVNTQLAIEDMASTLKWWIGCRRADGVLLRKDCVKALWVKVGPKRQVSDAEWLDWQGWWERRDFSLETW